MTIETNFLNCAAETLAELCPRPPDPCPRALRTAQIIFITKIVTGENLAFYAQLTGSPQSNAGKTA